MSNMYEDLRYRILLGQFSMLLYSAILAFLGRSGKAFLLAFILIILFSIVTSRALGGKGPLGKARPEDILAGKKVFEETSTRELQAEDKGLMLDLQEQSKFSMYNMVGMLAAMAYFFLLWPYTSHLYDYFSQLVGEGKLAHFLAYLVYFEGLFIISQASYVWALRKVGKVTMIQMPQSYTVTDKGIVVQGLVGKSAIPFPLPEEASINVNEKRKFVEIVVEGKKSVSKIRFYTRNPKRLSELLKRYGRRRP